RRRQARLGDVMVDDDDVEPARRRRRQRLVRGGAAIDGDDEARALLPEPGERGSVGAVTLAQAVRHIDAAVAADRAEEADEKRRRGGAVDIVIAEHDDLL